MNTTGRLRRLVRDLLEGRWKISGFSTDAHLRWQFASLAGSVDAHLQLELARHISVLRQELRDSMPDNPAIHGFKVYSQCDEDGIIETICNRLELEAGTFVEIGCGNGHENNTHYLLLKDWTGIWIDGDPSNIALIRGALVDVTSRLRVTECLVTAENISYVLREELAALGVPQMIDCLSVDIDGNDLPVALIACEVTSPKILVVEYNAKFPYPMSQAVRYDAAHAWKQDDYHGASLAALVEAFRSRYRLICCNLAGTNAFFIRRDLAHNFPLYEPAQLYQPARFYLTALRSGHPSSLSFLANHLSGSGRNVQGARRG